MVGVWGFMEAGGDDGGDGAREEGKRGNEALNDRVSTFFKAALGGQWKSIEGDGV